MPKLNKPLRIGTIGWTGDMSCKSSSEQGNRFLCSLLIGEAAPATVEAKLRRLIREDDDVVDVLDLRTMHMGPDDILVAAGVKFRPHLRTAEIENAVVRLQSAIRKALDGATNGSLILIEPTRPGANQSDRAA